jgi:hypothetical protein
MNTIVKLSVATALALGYATAHAQVAQPAGGSSDVILFAEIINSTGGVVASYARDTGVSINSILPGTGSLQAQGTTVPSTGFTNLTLPTINVAADANMNSFLALNAAGDSVEWAVQAGEYTGLTTTGNFGITGNAKFLTTASTGVTTITNKQTGNLVKWAGLDGTVTTLNANISGQAGNTSTKSTFGTSPASSGVWDATATGAAVANWFSNGAPTNPGTVTNELGTNQELYGVTGNGGSTAKVQVYDLGALTLSSNGTLSNVSAVPIPAAVWLLGSGLLGLAGIGRRKSTQA